MNDIEALTTKEELLLLTAETKSYTDKIRDEISKKQGLLSSKVVATSGNKTRWYKIAEVNISSINYDAHICLKVTDGYTTDYSSSGHTDKIVGILTAGFRSPASLSSDAVPQARLEWDYVSDTVKLEDFVLCYRFNEDSSAYDISLWVNMYRSYNSILFSELIAGNRQNINFNEWTLASPASSNFVEQLPDDYIQVPSTIMTIKNPTAIDMEIKKAQASSTIRATAGTAARWYKFAETVISAVNTSISISFKVNDGYPVDNSAYGNDNINGILTAEVASSNLGVSAERPLSVAKLFWEYASKTIVPDDFVLCWHFDAEMNSYIVSLYVNLNTAYNSISLTLLNECSATGVDYGIWTLFSPNTYTEYIGVLPEDVVKVHSTIMSLKSAEISNISNTLDTLLISMLEGDD